MAPGGFDRCRRFAKDLVRDLHRDLGLILLLILLHQADQVFAV